MCCIKPFAVSHVISGIHAVVSSSIAEDCLSLTILAQALSCTVSPQALREERALMSREVRETGIIMSKPTGN